MINLAIFSYLWGACSLNYYLLEYYLRFLPGNLYENYFASSCSELIAVVTAGFMYKFFKAKRTFQISFSIAIVGSSLIVFFGSLTLKLMPVYVIIAKFGIAAAYLTVYVATADTFPTLFCATAFGVCNFASSIITIPASYISELDAPIPMVVYALVSVLGLLLTFVIKSKKE